MARETTRVANQSVPGRPQPPSAPVRWLVAVALSVGGLVALVAWSVDRVETRLETSTNDRLRELGLDPTAFDIEFDGRNGTIVGPVPTGVTPAGLASRALVDGATSVEVVTP